MHYYIYPKGGNAKYVAWAIDYLNNATTSSGGGGITYSFVDDSDKQTSLEVLGGEIKSKIESKSAKLLLASKVYMDVLLDNICKQGIQECVDGIKFIAKQLNTYLREKYKNEKRLIAVMLNGYLLDQKHLGSILDILKEKDFKIIYIVSYTSCWFDELVNVLKFKNEDFFVADYEFLESLDFFPFLIEQADILKVNSNVRSLKLFTSMDQVIQCAYVGKDFYDATNLSFLYASYLNIHSKTHFDRIFKQQQYFNVFPDPSPRFVLGGYPSIDKEILDTEGLDDTVRRDTVIFISALLNLWYPDRLEKIIRECLKMGYRTLFKSCPPHCECKNEEDSFAIRFEGEPNFVYWDNTKPRLTKEEINRSICAIESNSSMCYSYPVLSKRPCILPYPKKDSIEPYILREDGFYNPSLHLRVFEDNEIVEIPKILHRLANDLEYQKEWKDKIDNYCKTDLYNYGNASEFVANWIIQWYNKRDILVKE